MMDLASRRVEAEAALAELQRTQGETVLAGQKFDTRKLATLEAEIDGLRRAEGAQARRDRAEAAEARKAERAADKAKLSRAYARYLENTAEAFSSGVCCRDALARAEAAREEMAALCAKLKAKTPNGLSIFDWASRFSRYLGAMMAAMPKFKARFGGINWPTSFANAEDDWRRKEEELLDHQISFIITGDNHDSGNGKRQSNGRA